MATAGETRRRFRLLYRIEAELEPVMFLLAIVWLWLFIVELAYGLAPWQQKLIVAIWIAFIVEFLLKLYLAPRRPRYLLKNWIAAVALVATPGGEPPRELESAPVVANGAALLLHLVGRLAGLDRDSESQVMRRFEFRDRRRSLPPFSDGERETLAAISARLPERELRGEATLASLVFHALMAIRHPAQTLKPLWRNKALLLPLSLPGLATAAVAPSFLLVFTAEIWDVGLGMSNLVAAAYATLSILGATLFLARVQSLFLPRKKRNVLTEHLASLLLDSQPSTGRRVQTNQSCQCRSYRFRARPLYRQEPCYETLR